MDITRVEGTLKDQAAGLYGLPNIKTIVVGAEVEGRYGRGRGFLHRGMSLKSVAIAFSVRKVGDCALA